MINTKEISKDIWWIGGSDRRLDLFENLFPLPNGVSYNSFLVMDEKTVLFDTADETIAEQFMENLQGVLGERKLEYLVILHMEPDHCSQIANVAALYPDITIVSNARTFTFIDQFFPGLKSIKRQEIKDGESFSSGKHTFTFMNAPMVHWPEVMFAYDDNSKALFTADAFGTFGALDSGIFADEYDFEKKYLDDARRYYSNIVGKYGVQVQGVLKKAQELDIQMLCPLHGPIWRENIEWFINKYNLWSTYEAEDDETVLIYGSMYGHTKSAAEKVASLIREKSGKQVSVYDASKTDTSNLISEVWRCKRIVIFCPTYNGGIYPPIECFINDMLSLGVRNRSFALAQNGTWGPISAKLMGDKLSTLKNVSISENILTIKSALHESDNEQINAFVDAVAAM
ncbi:MAG: FprA family A-type flavoprotein [Butyrivibrio sp.]|nr:FprA family A-type flavoprotein [Butyrivibrio sp.]